MGLFSKKSACPICGGKVSWFLPWKIGGEYICDTCHNIIDMESDKELHLTMQEFKEYLIFYNQNQLLKEQFVISERINLGFWDTKIIFDYQNKLFCMSKNLDKTVFEGKQLKSFSIKEDSAPLFEGSAKGIRRYASTVPERAMAMLPQIAQMIINRQMDSAIDKLYGGGETEKMQCFDMTEPLRAFNLELHFDHPYWTVIKCEMEAPLFDNNLPDVNDYIHSYRQSIKEIEKLVAIFKTVAFPGAPEQSVGFSAEGIEEIHTTIELHADTIEKIRKYRVLMKDGIISQQEFDTKKRQLLGI